MDFSNYKFRCSQLGSYMANGRGRNTMGETCKTALRKVYLLEKYGREEIIYSKYMEKGIMCEDDGVDLLGQHIGQPLFKYKDRLSNEFLVGTPDIVTDTTVYDIKSSWDLFTFDKARLYGKAAKDYEWQILGYMALTGKREAYVCYTLVDTPFDILEDEKRRLQHQLRIYDTADAAYQMAEQQLIKNHTFSDIPAEERITMFKVEYDQDKINALYARLKECREYLNNM